MKRLKIFLLQMCLGAAYVPLAYYFATASSAAGTWSDIVYVIPLGYTVVYGSFAFVMSVRGLFTGEFERNSS